MYGFAFVCIHTSYYSIFVYFYNLKTAQNLFKVNQENFYGTVSPDITFNFRIFNTKIVVVFKLLYLILFIIIVMDSGEGVCVYPGEKGAIMESGGSCLPGGGKGWQLAPDSGEEKT